MKKLVLLILGILVAGCGNEEIPFRPGEIVATQADDPAEEPSGGSEGGLETVLGILYFEGTTGVPQVEAKDVPECDNSKVPVILNLDMIHESGAVENYETPILYKDNAFSMIESIELPLGNYKVNEFYLTDEDENILYAAPSKLDLRYPFADMVNKPVPFEIEITEVETNQEIIETLCYSGVEFEFNGEAGWDGNSTALSPLLLFNNGFCDGIVVYENFGIEYPIGEDSPLVIPLLRYNGAVVNIYSLSRVLSSSIVFDTHELEWVYTSFEENGDVKFTNSQAYSLGNDNRIDNNNDGIMDAGDVFSVSTRCE